MTPCTRRRCTAPALGVYRKRALCADHARALGIRLLAPPGPLDAADPPQAAPTHDAEALLRAAAEGALTVGEVLEVFKR